MKDAAGTKTSKTDGRTLLVNSSNLRAATDNGPAAAAAADAADDAAEVDAVDARTSNNDDGAVVATGFAVIADYTDKVPANDFFTPGRLFAVRVKHADFPRTFLPLFAVFSLLCVSTKKLALRLTVHIWQYND